LFQIRDAAHPSPEIAGFVMGISANGHAAGAVQLRRNKTGFLKRPVLGPEAKVPNKARIISL
jgi:hypothetical protein